MAKQQVYPEITISRIKKPSKIYAFPLFGFVLKLILIIPVAIELFVLNIVRFIYSILNSFAIFASGKYWKTAYTFNLGVMRLETNVTYYLWGLTDMYPGFSLDTTNYDLDLDYNKTPSRFLATPIIGMLVRFLLMIPYMIYRSVVSTAATLAILVSWAFVLFQGRYPETTYEIARDSVRVDQAATAYFLGMSDKYPSFWISMNHKTLKLILLIIAAIFTLLTFRSDWGQGQQRQLRQNNRYMNTVQNGQYRITY